MVDIWKGYLEIEGVYLDMKTTLTLREKNFKKNLRTPKNMCFKLQILYFKFEVEIMSQFDKQTVG